MAWSEGLDEYSIRARLFPALLCILPVPILIAAVLPGIVAFWKGFVGSLIVASGGPFLIAEFGRDQGKRLEPELFDKWGGKPTTRLLSYSGPKSRETVSRIHRRLEVLFSDLDFPSAEEERSSPGRARSIYDEAVARLRTLTRDADEHPLVFKENVSYGFWRNLFGLRRTGLTLAIVGSLIATVLVVWPTLRPGQTEAERYIIAATVSGTLSFTWWLRVRPSWVRIPAEAYAERLMEAVTKLERETGNGGA